MVMVMQLGREGGRSAIQCDANAVVVEFWGVRERIMAGRVRRVQHTYLGKARAAPPLLSTAAEGDDEERVRPSHRKQ